MHEMLASLGRQQLSLGTVELALFTCVKFAFKFLSWLQHHLDAMLGYKGAVAFGYSPFGELSPSWLAVLPTLIGKCRTMMRLVPSDINGKMPNNFHGNQIKAHGIQCATGDVSPEL
ncbi:hypothetical protein KIL84_015553 [Mauremys mutica]|uniref:Uncharacterized protein n=1 Tax=Mauremys mutica TaxID=74926 RepID=A0A9D4AS08_9SAUR|nr:hypothetical protein KIL84_015553 [Mauremys mutica]